MADETKPTVYLETSVIGYLTSRTSDDPIVAAHQDTTRRWWSIARSRYQLSVSTLVLEEIRAGDPEAAAERLRAIDDIPIVEYSDSASDLAEQLLRLHAMPPNAKVDAYHVALATVNAMDFLLIWNFRHLVNVMMRPRIEEVCRSTGVEPPIICTPEHLLYG